MLISEPDDLTSSNSGGTSYWSFSLKPGEIKTIQYAMAWDDSKETLKTALSDTKNNFDAKWGNTQKEWESRWMAIFETDNDILSGTFPILESDDKVANRVYYTGPLTMFISDEHQFASARESLPHRRSEMGSFHYVLLGHHGMGYSMGSWWIPK